MTQVKGQSKGVDFTVGVVVTYCTITDTLGTVHCTVGSTITIPNFVQYVSTIFKSSHAVKSAILLFTFYQPDLIKFIESTPFAVTAVSLVDRIGKRFIDWLNW